jgi:hypothetical protein
VLWEAIRSSCRDGHRVFDFGRTEQGNEGLRAFELGWGARKEELAYTAFAASAPSPGSGWTHAALGTVIRRSPPWVGQSIGALAWTSVPLHCLSDAAGPCRRSLSRWHHCACAVPAVCWSAVSSMSDPSPHSHSRPMSTIVDWGPNEAGHLFLDTKLAHVDPLFLWLRHDLTPSSQIRATRCPVQLPKPCIHDLYAPRCQTKLPAVLAQRPRELPVCQ